MYNYFYDNSVLKVLTDIPLKSFFSIYRNLFARLAAEENLLSLDVEYPSFGYSTSSWVAVDGTGGQAARNFYTVWINFATAKDFTWFEQWNTSEAPDRRVRRYVICILVRYQILYLH
jgi:DnaJ homolog subfamily A member 5